MMFFLIFLAVTISGMFVYVFSRVSLCRGLVDLVWKISGGTGKKVAVGLPLRL